MDWFVSKEEIKQHFKGFMVQRTVALGGKVHIGSAETLLCKLILSNTPESENMITCSEVCRTYDCSERTSDYCRIKPNSKGKYDWVDWRVQAWRFQKAINASQEALILILGEKRINHFLAPIVDKGLENIQTLSRSDREEFLAKWVPNITQVDEEPITISDVENDFWSLYVQSQSKQEEHLLCC